MWWKIHADLEEWEIMKVKEGVWAWRKRDGNEQPSAHHPVYGKQISSLLDLGIVFFCAHHTQIQLRSRSLFHRWCSWWWRRRRSRKIFMEYLRQIEYYRLLIVRSAFAIWNTERCAILSVVCFVYTVCHSVCIRIRIRGRGRKMVYCAKMRWLNRTLREPHHKLFARNCACGKLC